MARSSVLGACLIWIQSQAQKLLSCLPSVGLSTVLPTADGAANWGEKSKFPHIAYFSRHVCGTRVCARVCRCVCVCLPVGKFICGLFVCLSVGLVELLPGGVCYHSGDCVCVCVCLYVCVCAARFNHVLHDAAIQCCQKFISSPQAGEEEDKARLATLTGRRAYSHNKRTKRISE